MREFLRPNIEKRGRIWRAVGGGLLLAGGVAAGALVSYWLAAVLALSGAFVLYEALRGWCFLRACGIRTRL